MENSKIAHEAYAADDVWWSPEENEFINQNDDESPIAIENRAAKTIDDQVSLILKNRPEVRHHPQMGHPEDADLSDVIDGTIRNWWTHGNVIPVLHSFVKESVITGLSFVKVGFDRTNKRYNQDGEAFMVNTPTRDIFWDPKSSNSQRGKDCRYIAQRCWQTPNILIEKFGVPAEELITPTRSYLGQVYDNIKGVIKEGRFLMSKQEYQAGLPTPSPDKPQTDRVDQLEEVWEYWLFPKVMSNSEIVGGENLKDVRYPYGVVVTSFRDKIIDIKSNPFISQKRSQEFEMDEMGNPTSKLKTYTLGHRGHPFVPMWWIRTTTKDGRNNFYMCQGAMRRMIAPQVTTNTLLRGIIKNCLTTANPQVLTFDDALKTPSEKIFLEPSDVIRINAKYIDRPLESLFRVLQPPSMPGYVSSMLAEQKIAVSEMGDMNPGMTGLWPTGTSHTTLGGTAIQNESQYTPLWAKTDELDGALKDIAEKALGLIQQNYKPGRFVDISVDGQVQYAQLQKKHVLTQFQSVIISGATTPFFDIDRDRRLNEIRQMVDQSIATALQTHEVVFMETCKIQLMQLKYPPAYQYIQLLEKEIQKLTQIVEGKQMMGLTQLLQQVQQGQQGGQGISLEQAGVNPNMQADQNQQPMMAQA